jgi:hypothetical protein
VWAALIAALVDARALLVVGGKVHDPADPDDGFMIDLGAALAVREAAITSKRTLRGVKSRAAAGRPHGVWNFGYCTEYDPETGKPLRRVLDVPKAAVVREIADRLLAGESASAIAADLNRRGVPSPHHGSKRTTKTGDKLPVSGRWIGGNLTALAKSPAYARLRVYRGRVLPDVNATWPAILTIEQHHQLRSLLDDPARMSSRTGSHVRHLLVGVAKCGECGGRIRALTRKRKTGKIVVYNCAEKFCVTRDAALVDDLVERIVVGRLAMPDFAADVAAGADAPDVRAAGEEVARLRAKLAEARRLVDADRLSLESLADFFRSK